MKLSGWVYLVVGVCLAVIILSYGYFQHYAPNMEEAQKFHENAEAYRPMSGDDAKKKAIKRVESAQAKVDAAAKRWNELVVVKTPPKDLRQGGIDLTRNRIYLTLDAPVFRDSIQKEVNNQLKKGGVKVVQGAQVPFPPTEYQQIVEGYFNWPAYAFPVCIFDFGTITVEGTYKQITDNVRSWSNMPNYIAVTDGLQLTGTSPKLTGSYQLTVVAMIRGDKIAPPVGNAGPPAAAGAAAGAPAAPGGRGGPGLPPGVPGGGPGPNVPRGSGRPD
jgi:hypothetical protein